MEVPEIEAYDLIDRQARGCFVLDVRRPEEYEEGHIAGDSLMCDQLCRLGYGDGVQFFIDMGKWYA